MVIYLFGLDTSLARVSILIQRLILPEDALKQIQHYHISDSPHLVDFFDMEFLKSKPKDYNQEKFRAIFNKLESSLQEAKLSHLLPVKMVYFKTSHR